ncbi:hypothetical protein AVEN_222421-1 [Araneus ventricosus]|uniref:Uncharacterized protein n=1 Tax=Araneus ventricosus TaxID=182803 RepID=A0A4Y2J6L2_ARAVE|nr:hypothetical protein AVEN_222421-1 [Araneus ventricosus]
MQNSEKGRNPVGPSKESEFLKSISPLVEISAKSDILVRFRTRTSVQNSGNERNPVGLQEKSDAHKSSSSIVKKSENNQNLASNLETTLSAVQELQKNLDDETLFVVEK